MSYGAREIYTDPTGDRHYIEAIRIDVYGKGQRGFYLTEQAHLYGPLPFES